MMVHAIPLCSEFLPEKIEFNGERQYCSFFVLKSFCWGECCKGGKSRSEDPAAPIRNRMLGLSASV